MRSLRLPRWTAIVLAVLAVVLLAPRDGELARPSAAEPDASGLHSVLAVRTVADVTAASGGLCSVPGIGDIGGLLGFCALGSSGLTGDLNNICQPSLPDPEPAGSGIDGMVSPPETGKQPVTLYDEYGVAGDYWAATNLQCSDMTSLIGNNVAGMVLDAAKSIDRVTITVYQSAAGEGILAWLQRETDKLITSLGGAIYFPYLAVVVILAAIWLAWQGLIRKRGTRTIEGTIWMVAACAAAIFLIGKPADVTGLGRGVSDGISEALNVAFAKLPSPGPSSCVPIQKGDPQAEPASYSYTSGSTVVDQNADELWDVLVCKPWLVGEFGTSEYAPPGAPPTVVNKYGRSLLWAQAIAVNEKATPALIQAKQAAYAGIASSIQANDPASYPLFQGKQWTTRLEVAFAALFAAVVAGFLVLLISVTLILLKLGFLLLLIVGPFFLLIGAHPGFGRVVALRWVELLIGVLLKQAAVALVLSVLLYCYALIMGTSDAVLPWALKILMIALVTVAAFIYRKPFQHLFSAVGYGVIGATERADADLQRAGATARANTLAAATAAVPPFAAYRAGRWAKRNPAQASALALAATGAGTAAVAGGLRAGSGSGGADGGPGGEGNADGANPGGGNGGPGGGGPGSGADGSGGRLALASRARASPTQSSVTAEPPPLNLPPRTASTAAGPSGNRAPASWPPGSRPPSRQPTASPSSSATSQARTRSAPVAGRGARQPVGAPPRGAARVSPPPGSAVRASAPLASASPASASPASVSPASATWASPGPAGGNSHPGPRQPLSRRAASGPASQRPQSSSRPGPWQGQQQAEPLSRPGALGQAERPLPFWLRPIRRK
jgi:hypothetical protein